MPQVKVKDINVIAVYVSDINRSIDFYSQLGFEVLEDLPPGILLKSGNVTLYLEAGRQTKDPNLGTYSEFSPCFATDSVKSTYESLKDSEVEIVDHYQEFAPTFASFRIVDPDGNLIEFAGKP